MESLLTFFASDAAWAICIFWALGMLVGTVWLYVWQLRRSRDRLASRLTSMLHERNEPAREPAVDLKSTDVCRRFAQMAAGTVDGSPSPDDWRELAATVNECHPHFSDNLQALHSFSDIELKTTLLVKCALSPSDIAKLTFRSPEAISSTRRRLAKKVLHADKPSPAQWDAFVHTL